MPEEERRTRMGNLRRRVMSHDAYQWEKSFVSELNSCCPHRAVSQSSISSQSRIELFLRKLRRAKQLFLFLDYDGTLVSFRRLPALAAPDSQLKELLMALSTRSGTHVHIVSGRPYETLERWLGDLPIGLHAEYGYWSRMPDHPRWAPMSLRAFRWKQKVLPLLEQFVSSTPGSLIEEKTVATTWHYRMVDPELGKRQAKVLKHRLEKELEEFPIDVLEGEKIIEVRIRGINKGKVVSRIIEGVSGPICTLAAGNDVTDEDLFAALPPDGLSVKVGPGPSCARFRLAGPDALRSLLSQLLVRAVSSQG